MSLIPRTVECDMCGFEQQEDDINTGFKGWSTIHGIGAAPPIAGQCIKMRNLEYWCCPNCTQKISKFINENESKTVRLG